MDARKTQNPERSFGAAPTAAWTAFRQRVPLRQRSAEPAAQSTSLAAAEFLKTTAASTFYHGGGEP